MIEIRKKPSPGKRLLKGGLKLGALCAAIGGSIYAFVRRRDPERTTPASPRHSVARLLEEELSVQKTRLAALCAEVEKRAGDVRAGLSDELARSSDAVESAENLLEEVKAGRDTEGAELKENVEIALSDLRRALNAAAAELAATPESDGSDEDDPQ